VCVTIIMGIKMEVPQKLQIELSYDSVTHYWVYTKRKWNQNIKEWNPIVCDNMGGTGDHYSKWNKSGRESQNPSDLTHMWNTRKLISWWLRVMNDGSQGLEGVWERGMGRGWSMGTKLHLGARNSGVLLYSKVPIIIMYCTFQKAGRQEGS
jgi:hypothetical protein